MKITAIQPQKNHPDRVNVHVDGAFRFALGAELAWGAHLHVGDAITEARIAELERKDLGWKAREAALGLLAFRPRTAVELRRRLARKEFPQEVVEECVEGLERLGLVDDASFAQTFVRDRVRLRPKGRRALAQELRARGVEVETAQEAISEIFEAQEVSETELAREAAAKWHPRAGEERRKARARLYAFLARRGFGAEAIRAVMDERIQGGPDDRDGA